MNKSAWSLPNARSCSKRSSRWTSRQRSLASASAFETIFIPFASGSENPFTGKTAGDLGRSSIRDNSPEIEIELNLEWLRSEDTGGWVGSHFDIIDKISPSERPADASVYTHKLNFELDTAVHVFNWLPDGNLAASTSRSKDLLDYRTHGTAAAPVIGSETSCSSTMPADGRSPWCLSSHSFRSRLDHPSTAIRQLPTQHSQT